LGTPFVFLAIFSFFMYVGIVRKLLYLTWEGDDICTRIS